MSEKTAAHAGVVTAAAAAAQLRLWLTQLQRWKCPAATAAMAVPPTAADAALHLGSAQGKWVLRCNGFSLPRYIVNRYAISLGPLACSSFPFTSIPTLSYFDLATSRHDQPRAGEYDLLFIRL